MAGTIKIKNIYYMLSYAYQNLRQTGFDHLASEDFDTIHDLFAAILAQGVADQVRRGLYRDYTLREEALSGLRGQIQLAPSIQQQTLSQGKLICAYDVFTEDVLHNQILKSTMEMLLRHGDVRRENKKALRKLLLYFGNVREIDPGAILWKTLQYHRHNASYRTLVELCALAVKGFLLTTEKGSHRLATWLQDEAMHRLYEKFVLSYYQRHHPSLSPRGATVEWDLRNFQEAARLPIMKTDITLSRGEKRLIIDTKYYNHTMQASFYAKKATFISGHLYQMYAYVKNSDREGTGNIAGVVLYAKTDEAVTPNEDFNLGGNIISLKTLDLNREWNAITEQLDRLCEGLYNKVLS